MQGRSLKRGIASWVTVGLETPGKRISVGHGEGFRYILGTAVAYAGLTTQKAQRGLELRSAALSKRLTEGSDQGTRYLIPGTSAQRPRRRQ